MRVVLVACTNVGRAIVEEIQNNSAIRTELAGIVNLNVRQAMNKANYDSYADLAEKYGIPIFYCDNVNDPESMAFIREKKPDILLQSGWSQKFSEELLGLPRFGCIGEHPAPLPKGRGAACVNWAILQGETEWGDSFFRMVQEYDKGPLYAQSFFDIRENDTVYTVYEKVARSAAGIVRENLDLWASGELQPIPQQDEKATYYKRRRPSDGEIRSFDQPAKVLHDFIRAQTEPYPGAFFVRNGCMITVLSSHLCPEGEDDCLPGTVLGETEDGGLLVSCQNKERVVLLRVRPEHEPSAWAADWLQREGIRTGESLLLPKKS